MGTAVILPDLILPSRVNQRWQYSGIDSPEDCNDKQHFQNYPYTVDYVYNSRGFRDQEWPDSLLDLQEAIWCVGDSFTVGLGQPFQHIWPQILQKFTGRRTVNLGLDGASNQWIARRVNDIRNHVGPRNIVIMWSYLERRELSIETAKQFTWEVWYQSCKDATWPKCPAWNELYLLPDDILTELRNLHGVPIDPTGKVFVLDYLDENRRTQDVKSSFDEDFENWCRVVEQIETASNTVHAMIPKFASAGQINQAILHLKGKGLKCIGECKQLDWARDHHHFDILTSQWVVDQIIPRLCA